MVFSGMPQAARRVLDQCAALGIAAALVLSACSNVDTARWTEEVKSWDGHVFQLEGYAEKDKGGWPLSHRGMTRFIEYYHRESGAYWKQPYGYQPVLFDIFNGRPVVVVQANSDSQCMLHGFPPEGALAFAWGVNGWVQVPFNGLPVDKMTFNVLRRIFDQEDSKKDARGHISLVDKRQRDLGDIRLSEWMLESGRTCAGVKEQVERGRKSDIPPAPVLTGFHGRPDRSEKG